MTNNIDTRIGNQCAALKDGQILRGIYTGYSTITKCYHVSFYNGATGKYKTISDITF
jgi:hypothetical protein